MTAKNRTSTKNKKAGKYIDHTTRDSQKADALKAKARKFQQLRAIKRPAPGPSPAAGIAHAAAANAAAAASAAATAAAAAHPASDEEEADEEAEEGEAAADEEAEAAAEEDASEDRFSVSLTPFVSSDSKSIASTTESSLKDDHVLGMALYEWLLPKEGWDCHRLWERFLLEWDLITETERPPGTNRPMNLHGYLTFLRNTNNKATVRRDVRTCRDTLLRERESYLAGHPDDPRAKLNVEALQGGGALLLYYLKIKNLIPYESAAQLKRKENKRKRLEMEQQRQGQDANGHTGGDAVLPAAAAAEEASEQKQQHHAAKKGKHAHATAAAAPSRPQPAKSKLQLGQPNAFAALLDCD